MFLILNRLRGTNGVWSKFNGLLLAYIIYSVSHNHYLALAVGIGYVIGESFGWGEWIGNLSCHKSDVGVLGDEGKNNGIQWLASKIVPDYTTNYINYCRVALTIRGFYWWFPTLSPLYFVGFEPLFLLGCVMFLSVGFPIACEVGYYTSKKFNFSKYGFNMHGGWEHQEVWYGFMQDLIFGGILLWLYL